MADRKLILAPGEKEKYGGGFSAICAHEDVQRERRIGAAIVLREMAEIMGSYLPSDPSVNDYAWCRWIRQTLEARAEELEAEQ